MKEDLTMKEFKRLKDILSFMITTQVRCLTNEFETATGIPVKAVVMTRHKDELCPAIIDVDLRL